MQHRVKARIEVFAASTAAAAPGAQLYLQKCGYCHGRDGQGRGTYVPPLSPHPDSVVNIILNGGGAWSSTVCRDSYRMPPYRVQLNDREIAEIATFVRKSWGNAGGAVTLR
ncbi:c-type cytochrome [Pseudaminobacter soli (ex Li et al. 2025)]|uniref:c-type cytochrome n=1 Tax=Pseudaminobacter soli (ex Li et al. 2025) TaxID=1295366 RepID=UPI0015E78C04|nr:cytochrome c [Mesorhizobium soli]